MSYTSKPSKLEELMRIADTAGLSEQEKALVEAEFNHGVETYKGRGYPPVQSAASLYDFVQRSEDAGYLCGARQLKAISAKKDVVWPVVEAAKYNRG